MTAGVNLMTDLARLALVNPASLAQVNYASDTIYYLLVNTTEDAVATATQQGYTLETGFNANEHPTANGYTVQGMDPGGHAATQAAHVVKVTSSAATWTATTTLTAFGAWLVKHVGAAGSNPALLYFSFNASISATGALFTVTPNAAGLFTISGG